jgi:TPP-dependent pyruvate/acetoin dehydrogenase alpha subunit
MNIVSLWKLPLLVVLENNGWSQSTPLHLNCAGDMVARFTAFGLPVRAIDTTDVLEIDGVAREEIKSLRDTKAPRVLLIHTYRLCHHSHHDDHRPQDEVAARWKVEPLRLHGQRLSGADRKRLDMEVDAAIEELVAIVRSLP